MRILQLVAVISFSLFSTGMNAANEYSETTQQMASLIATAKSVGLIAKNTYEQQPDTVIQYAGWKVEENNDRKCLTDNLNDAGYAQSLLPLVKAFVKGNSDNENQRFIALLNDDLSNGMRNFILISRETTEVFHKGEISYSDRKALIDKDPRITVKQRLSMNRLTDPDFQKLGMFLMTPNKAVQSLEKVTYQSGVAEGMTEEKRFIEFIKETCQL